MNKRRHFLLSAGALLVLPHAAFAQRTAARRIGVLGGGSSADLEMQTAVGSLVSGLQQLGWSNPHVFTKYAERDPARLRQAARELLGFQPEVIVAATSNDVAVLRDLTLSIPIVFTQVPDPVGAGLVTSFGRPIDNVTGLAGFDPALCEPSLRAIKTCAPGTSRVAVVFDPADPTWLASSRAIDASARALGMAWSPLGAQGAELERGLGDFARAPNGGLFVLPHLASREDRDLVIQLAAKNRLPAIYSRADFAANGGLMSYAVNVPDLYRHAAAYVDRILRGARPADLPVGRPAKFDFAVNVQTAKALGFKFPQTLLAQADQVIG